MTLTTWMRRADVEDDVKPGVTSSEFAQLKELRMRCRQRIAGKRYYPVVSEYAADGIPMAVTCRVLKVARATYYRWRMCPVTGADLTEAYRANALFNAHRDDPEFGYRFLVEGTVQAGELMAAQRGGSVRPTGGGVCSASFGVVRIAIQARRCMTITSSVCVSLTLRTGCGSAIVPSIAPMKARSTRARSRMCSPTPSSAYSIVSRMKSHLAVTALSHAGRSARNGGRL